MDSKKKSLSSAPIAPKSGKAREAIKCQVSNLASLFCILNFFHFIYFLPLWVHFRAASATLTSLLVSLFIFHTLTLSHTLSLSISLHLSHPLTLSHSYTLYHTHTLSASFTKLVKRLSLCGELQRHVGQKNIE